MLKQGSLAYNESMIGKTYRVLIDGQDPRMEGALKGRTEGKLPVRVLDGDEALVGTFQPVKITSVSALSLTGTRVC